jgi:hypothetical protein
VFPADAEASYDKPALSSYAEQYARKPNSALEMRSQTALPYTVQIADG